MIKVKIVGVPKVLGDFKAKGNKLKMTVSEAIERAAILVKNRSITAYLRGPRPKHLAVVTGNLWKSIRAWKEYDTLKSVITGKVGTNVWYGKMWETEGVPEMDIYPTHKKALYWKGARHPVKRVHQRAKPARPFLKPALLDLKPQILEMLKQATTKGVE